MWSFLTGEADTVKRAGSIAGGALAVVLVDQHMRVRGRYDLADPTAIDTFLYHVGLLVNRGN